MKIQFLTTLVSLIVISCLFGEDLEVILMEAPKEGPSPFQVDSKSPTPMMAPVSKTLVEILTSDDPSISPKARIAETRVIHGAKEGQVYHVIPASTGYQNLEFSFQRLKNGFSAVEVVRGSGKKRTTTKMTIESHLLVELRNPTTGKSIFCVLGVGVGG